MLLNYFKIAVRSLLKHPSFSFINIAGLSTGLACSILILLWVNDEVTFNQYFPKYDNIYKVRLNASVDKGIVTGESVPYALKDVLPEKDSRIKRTVRTNWGEGALLAVGDKKLNKVGLWATESFFDMFGFEMLKGTPRALDDPRSIVLTASLAKALFGDEDPLNKMVQIDNQGELKVTGVVADLPENTTFSQHEFFISYGYYELTQSWVGNVKDRWDNNVSQVYVELQPGTPVAEVDDAIRGIIAERNPDLSNVSLFLHPMSHWRLYSYFTNGKESGGMILYVQLFTGIAIFILVIACINFMNLATARSERRAREVGIRKSIGSRRKDLIFQFLGESILLAVLAFLVSIVLVELLLPLYNQLVSKQLTINYSSPTFWLLGLGLTVATGVLAGSYPAFYLSSFNPVQVLKGKVQVAGRSATPRQILVTLQFVFSILLTIAAIVVYQQIEHLRKREVGYDRENLLLIWTTSDIEKNYRALKTELLASGYAESMCKSNSPVTAIFSTNTLDDWPGRQEGQRIEFTTIATEYDYTKTLGIRLLQGRDFSPEFPSDSTAILVNQATVDVLNLENPIGETVKMWEQDWHIIGVTENILMGAAHRPIEPMIMVMSPTWSSTISVRLRPGGELSETLAGVETIFRKYNPAYPFEYRFADQEFEQKFATFNMIGRLSNAFTILTLLITALGLFGLASFATEQRSKEISIRKVMGASVASLVLLITRDFSRLVLIAFVIAAPAGWYFMNQFLERYAYRVEIAVWVLPAAGLSALALTLAIVSAQALKSAAGNPVDSLRSE
ncbi:MAG: ABC transporter permease [Cyclobacteriaceae bacterium]|nr:ABC transporter permease [Cyclobacteriaceae bacterium]